MDEPIDSPSRPGVWRRRLLIAALVAVVLAVGAVYGAFRTAQAAELGRDGKTALLAVETALREMDPDAAALAAQRAQRAFREMEAELRAMGPLRPVGRAVPLARTHVRAADAIARAGSLLAESAAQLVETSGSLLDPADPDVDVAKGMRDLEGVRASLADALVPLEQALEDVADLRDLRLAGPLRIARDQLLARLPDALDTARDAEAAVEALVVFAGGDGPRRYLILSQNPDEIRPTGGFIGTYGVLTTDGDTLDLERYEGIEHWPALNTAVIPAAEAPTVFRLPQQDRDQQLANANATASWRTSAALAARLWEMGGEQPVDGVIGITPETLARLVRVLGPVEVPTYGETVTADNLVDRVDYYAHRAGLTDDRKQFVADLAEVVLTHLLDAPATQWVELGRALGVSLDARETMVWAKDDRIDEVIADRGWDGTIPEAEGDFFYAGEFAYANKNGRGLHRTFDHHVEVRDDGSAQVTTKITTANTRPPSSGLGETLNVDAVRYVTVYGPEGASLAEGTNDPIAEEEPMAGHPAFGFEATGPPLGQSSFTVRWDVPRLLVPGRDGPEYRLTWLRIPAHTGDVLRLRVDLPPGWEWADRAPPTTFNLRTDIRGTWSITTQRD